MTSRNWFVCTRMSALMLLAGTASAAMARSDDRHVVRPGNASVEAAFLKANPGTSLYRWDDRITTVYGRAFERGDSPGAVAEAFIARNAGLFGVTPESLVPGTLAKFDAPAKGLMWQDDTGSYKFTLLSFLQTHDGIPVFQSDLRLLVRNEPGNPLVLARSALRSVGDFQIDANAAAEPNIAGAFERAIDRHPGIGSFTPPRVVIFAGDADTAAPARLAVEFEGSVGEPGDFGYEKWHLIADAATGEIIRSQSMITHVDVTGSVKGMATPGYKADICATEVVTPLPYARASIGSTVAYADANGNFTIPNAGSGSVTVTSEIRGRWFRVYDSAAGGANPNTLTMNVTPPGPANFVHNPSNSSATDRSAVNAYIGANRVRDYTLTYDPSYPTIGNQQEWRININVSGSCNAFYNGSSINFYAAGGGCPSTAFGSVVYHEYGHHMVNVAGSGQGMYGEGFGDLMGVVMDDDPVLGYGFSNNCNNGIRTANNGLNYPCSGEIHYCGQLLTACFWSTRNELIVSNPSNYRDLLGSWAVNSVQLHNGTEITPQITIDVLTLDDDDADISNGTPHYAQINEGFSDHNMDGPAIDALSFSFPEALPEFVDPEGGTTIKVEVTPNLSNTLDTSSGRMYVDVESDGSFVSTSMSYLGSNVFEATFPPSTCGTTVRYYFEAKTGSGTTLRSPLTAPAEYRSILSARGIDATYADNCDTPEGDNGWESTYGPGVLNNYGVWERAVPDAGAGGPALDFDGSGSCWVTANLPTSNPKTDPKVNVPVVLTSSTISDSVPEAVFSYATWLSIVPDRGDDSMLVEVSNNNGATWTTLENATASTGGWQTRHFRLADYLPVTSQMKFRFTVTDAAPDSPVEAALDAFSIGIIECYCPADHNQDGFVTGEDFDEFIGAFEAGDGASDFNGDGFVTGEDFDEFSIAFSAGC